jgi:26S proteasome regulatory subunit N7
MKVPDLSLAQHVFVLKHHQDSAIRATSHAALMASITQHNMEPYYTHLCEEGLFTLDTALQSKLRSANTTLEQALEVKLQDCKENLGETEVADCLKEIASHYATIGDKEKALQAYRVAIDQIVSAGHRLDLHFAIVRVGFFFSDHDLTNRTLTTIHDLLQGGSGDWDRRNRLKAYQALQWMRMREFTKAAHGFLDAIATFDSEELMSFEEFCCWCVLMGVVGLERVDLKKKVIDSPEILQVMHHVPQIQLFVNSLHETDYAAFFRSLAHVQTHYLQGYIHLYPHRHYYVREVRIKAYAQMLESYQRVEMSRMAEAFGVSIEFLDADLARFIAAGRLHCLIDKVAGVIETRRPDSKNALYQAVVKQGDTMLNRLQKLGRVIHV